MWIESSRRASLVATTCVSLFALGCGSDSGNGNIDASTGTLDAAVNADAGVEPFLGLSCPESDCTAADSTCLSVKTVPTKGYCSIPCGESNALGLPPPDGDAMCAGAYDQAIGTAKCGIVIDSRMDGNATIYTWACAIDCSADDQCPNTDLSCQDFNVSDRFCLRQ